MNDSWMHALVLHHIGDLRYERVPRPPLAQGEALIRVVAVGVCGSDIPRIFEHGTYRFPLIPGHEIAGIIEEVAGPGPRQVGERVAIKPLIPCKHCPYCEIGAFGQCLSYDYLGSRSDGGFAEFVKAPQENLVPLPEQVDLVEAALTEPAAVALHAIRQAEVQPGDTVAILGTGPIGMMIAQWARIHGAGQILLVDIDPQKLQHAQKLGLGFVCNAREEDPVQWIKQRTSDQGAPIVIEAAGTSITFEQALRAARPLGRVVIVGNPSSDVHLPQKTVSQILRKQLCIKGTWNSHFARLPVDEWRVVVEMLAAGKLNLRDLISHRIPLAEAPSFLRAMYAKKGFFLRVVLLNKERSSDESSSL